MRVWPTWATAPLGRLPPHAPSAARAKRTAQIAHHLNSPEILSLPITRFKMKLRPPNSHWTARCVVLGRARSAATIASCVLASHSPIAPCRRNFILKGVLSVLPPRRRARVYHPALPALPGED